MNTFRISLISTNSDGIVHIGKKIWVDDVEAEEIKETPSGYCLVDSQGGIVCTVPSGVMVEKITQR